MAVRKRAATKAGKVVVRWYEDGTRHESVFDINKVQVRFDPKGDDQETFDVSYGRGTYDYDAYLEVRTSAPIIIRPAVSNCIVVRQSW